MSNLHEISIGTVPFQNKLHNMTMQHFTKLLQNLFHTEIVGNHKAYAGRKYILDNYWEHSKTKELHGSSVMERKQIFPV